MNVLNPPKFVTRSLIGVVGLSAIAFFGVAESVKAFTVNSGTDYVITPKDGATINFIDSPLGMGIVPVSLTGLPIGTTTYPTPPNPNGGYSGEADTVINRLKNVDLTTSSEGKTPLEIVGLSLQSLNVKGYDVFVGLQKYLNGVKSTGNMTIRSNHTWDSEFTINGVAIFAEAGTLTPTNTDFVRGLVEGCPNATTYTCVNFTKGLFKATNERWSDTPLPGQITGPNLVSDLPTNFYLTNTEVIHDTGDGTIHIVKPVPEPLTILGSATALGFGSFFKRKLGKKRQQDKA